MSLFHTKGEGASLGSRSSGRHALYRELAWLYDKMYARIFPYEETFNFLNRLLKEHNCHSILEVACGTGLLMEILERNGYEVTGLDLSCEMLKIARKRCRGRLLRQDMRNIQLRRCFDALLCLGRSFTYMMTDEDVEKSIGSFSRSLKVGGILIFDNFDAECRDESYFKEWRRQEFEFETYRVTRLSKSFDYDEGNNSWLVKWLYIIEKDGKRETVRDEARLRAFHESYLKEKLRKHGFNTLESVHKWNSLILIAKKIHNGCPQGFFTQ